MASRLGDNTFLLPKRFLLPGGEDGGEDRIVLKTAPHITTTQKEYNTLRVLHDECKDSVPEVYEIYRDLSSFGEILPDYLINERYSGFTMEYVDGYTLSSLDERKMRKFSVEDGRDYLRQLLAHVTCFCDRGVYNRDIHPENVIIDPSTKRLFVIDFDSLVELKSIDECMKINENLLDSLRAIIRHTEEDGRLNTVYNMLRVGRCITEIINTLNDFDALHSSSSLPSLPPSIPLRRRERRGRDERRRGRIGRDERSRERGRTRGRTSGNLIRERSRERRRSGSLPRQALFD